MQILIIRPALNIKHQWQTRNRNVSREKSTGKGKGSREDYRRCWGNYQQLSHRREFRVVPPRLADLAAPYLWLRRQSQLILCAVYMCRALICTGIQSQLTVWCALWEFNILCDECLLCEFLSVEQAFYQRCSEFGACGLKQSILNVFCGRWWCTFNPPLLCRSWTWYDHLLMSLYHLEWQISFFSHVFKQE